MAALGLAVPREGRGDGSSLLQPTGCVVGGMPVVAGAGSGSAGEIER